MKKILDEPFTPFSQEWRDLGVIFQRFDTNIQTFTSCAAPLDDGWQIWYSSSKGKSDEGFNIGFITGLPGKKMYDVQAKLFADKANCSGLSICNLPEGWRPRQPVHIIMPDSSHRLYFWAHCNSQRVVRFLCATSNDGTVYEVIDPYRPCLWHYNDRVAGKLETVASGLTSLVENDYKRPDYEPEAAPEMLCNDATNLYLLPDGTFEMFTAKIAAVNIDDPRYIAHDNAAGWLRIIERRTSSDGVNWSRGETVLEPDANDPFDLQFYYLAVTHVPEGRIGLLGRYLAQAQTMDIEWCFSKDGITWERPCRKAWLKRSPDLLGIYAPHSLVFKNNQWYLFYTGCNYNHNFTKCTSGTFVSDIRLAVLK